MKEFEPVRAIFKQHNPDGNNFPTEETKPLYEALYRLTKSLKDKDMPTHKVYQYMIAIINKVVTTAEKENLDPEIQFLKITEPQIIANIKDLYEMCFAKSSFQSMLKEIQVRYCTSLVLEAGMPLVAIQDRERSLLLQYKKMTEEDAQQAKLQFEAKKQAATQGYEKVEIFCAQYRLK